MRQNKMDNQLKEHLTDIKEAIKVLDSKLDNYQERLIKVESTLGFVKVGALAAMSAIGTLGSYLIYKLIDIWSTKG